jgi:hypothetical protein
VRVVRKDFSLDDYIEDCTDSLNTQDAVILGPELNAPCQKSESHALWVYASIGNSRFLHSTSLYEIKLETHCVVLSGDYVFMTDSSGIFPDEYLEEQTTRVSVQRLTRYIDEAIRPTHVSVDSSIPYDTVIRGAELRGHNLLAIPASLTDRVHICRSARGSSKDAGRRYVGMSKGRIRKEVSRDERESFDPEAFVAWAEAVATILNSGVTVNPLFQRYMPTCAPPSNPIPRTISLDILRLDMHMTLADGSECTLHSSSAEIEETSHGQEISYQCSFALEASSGKAAVAVFRITYQPAKQRFWFSKADGETVRVTIEDGGGSPRKSLVEFLNQNQDIVLIGLDGGEIVYQGRNFYKIDYSFAEDVLLDLIKRPKNVPACRTEKGSKSEIALAQQINATEFPDGSLFRAITERQIKFPFGDRVLICDDMATECADFVAVDFGEHQLALVHAKAGSGTKISASAFHDVVAQAMKNLVYLARNNAVPNKIGKWRHGSTWNKTGVSRLYRIPANVPTAKSLWKKIRSEIINSSNPELSVVLVTTGCCDLNELKQAAHDSEKRTPQIAQLLHLIDGLNGYARQLGVRLLIYDIPYAAN